MNLEQIKADLLYKASLDDVASGETNRQTVDGMRNIPVRKMIDAIDYIDKNLLPAIKKKSGEKGPDYEFFRQMIDLLIWGLVLVDRYEAMEGRVGRMKVEIHFLREWMTFYERELGKYTSLEELMLTKSLDKYAKSIQERVEALRKVQKLG